MKRKVKKGVALLSQLVEGNSSSAAGTLNNNSALSSAKEIGAIATGQKSSLK